MCCKIFTTVYLESGKNLKMQNGMQEGKLIEDPLGKDMILGRYPGTEAHKLIFDHTWSLIIRIFLSFDSMSSRSWKWAPMRA